MPTYDYKCEACENTFEAFRQMKADHAEECPKCGKTETARVPSVPNTDMREFGKPIEMYSIALNTPEEIEAFKRKCDVECESDPNHPMYGIPIARTRKQKLAALGAVGFVESK